jgi:hypothetical protein
MSDTIVLRKVYALNYLTGQFLSSGQTLVTDGVGGTLWVPLLSTLSTISTGIYTNSQAISSISTFTSQNFSTISSVLAQLIPSTANGETLASTVTSLGTLGYISSAQLISTVAGIQNINNFTENLSSLGYISTAALTSTVVGLGTAGYVSTSAFTGFFTSTVAGLGTVGYISSLSLNSTINNLGTIGFISTANLQSTVDSLATVGYISSSMLKSTVNSLGTMGYVSTFDLISTTIALSSMKANIRFDNTTTVNVQNANVTFTNVGTLIYTSTIFASTILYSGNNMTTIEAAIPKLHELQFSTASINFSPFSSIIDSNSRITLDFYPTIAFTKLATGANNVAMLPISSFLQIGPTPNLSTTTVSYLYAGNTQIFQTQTIGGGTQITTYIDASNIWNQPFRMAIPKNTIPGNYLSNFNLVHIMPSSLNNGAFQNALHSNLITPLFPSTNSIFITIQNQA